MPRAIMMAAALVAACAAGAAAGRPGAARHSLGPDAGTWGGLRSALAAWVHFGLDSAHMSFEVTQSGRTLFKYPGSSPDARPARGGSVDIKVTGGRSDLLQNIAKPYVAYIAQGEQPQPDGGSVSRHDLVAQGGGVTLLDLAAASGALSNASRRALPQASCACKSDYPYCWDSGSGHDGKCYRSATSESSSSSECVYKGSGYCTSSYGPAPPPGPAPRPPSPPPPGDAWQPLRDGLDAWAALGWDTSFTFNVGDAEKTLFTHQVGRTSMKSTLPGASLSKWPAAMMISGLVADGTLSYDDKVNKHLSWWAKSGSWGEVTLRHLLTFQTGISDDAEASCSRSYSADFLSCAKDLYDASSENIYTPGTHWAYLDSHLQWAGAVAVSASGLKIQQLFEKYLYKPLGMTGTSWSPANNPQMATGIRTTGADFEKMLRGLLTYKFLGKAVLDDAERDWSAPPVSPCGDGWFGHYAMGHWFDCLDYGAGQRGGSSAALPSRCRTENIQSGPGAFGYYPLIDRNRGYYMQIVLAEDEACKSEIPEYLRAAAKPIVDAIVEGKAVQPSALYASGGAVTLPEILDIYNYMPTSQGGPCGRNSANATQ